MDVEKEDEPTVIGLLSALTGTVDRIELGQFDLIERVGRLEVGQEQIKADLNETKIELSEKIDGLGERMDSLEETFVDYATVTDNRLTTLELKCG